MTDGGRKPSGRNEGTRERMNRNKICLNLKARINYICKIFNHSLIQFFKCFLVLVCSKIERKFRLSKRTYKSSKDKYF